MQRPTAVTVFGVLNIVFGAMSLLCTPLALLGLFAPGQANPVLRILQASAAYRSFMIIAVVVGMLAGVVLIVAGIGLLKLQPWARLTSIGYAAFTIAWGFVGMLVNWLLVFKPLLDEFQGKNTPEAFGAIGAAIGSMVGSCVGLIYPVLLLIFLTRPKLRAAFEQPPSSPIS